MPRNYEAKSEFVLVNPAPPPTDAQIEKNPSLALVNRNNPYLRFANEGTVGHVLSGRMSGDSSARRLPRRAATPTTLWSPPRHPGRSWTSSAAGPVPNRPRRRCAWSASRMQTSSRQCSGSTAPRTAP